MSTQIDLGPVLSVPRGDWNAETTYEMLNLVRHNSAAWICKVATSKGVEPTIIEGTDGNEHWMLQVRDTSAVSSVNGMTGAVTISTIATPAASDNSTKITNTEWVTSKTNATLASAKSYTDTEITEATSAILEEAAETAQDLVETAVNSVIETSRDEFATKDALSGYASTSALSTLSNTVDGKAPKSHASSATTYGVSTASNYGHAKASATTPAALGTASAGSETSSFARGDHVHPTTTASSSVLGMVKLSDSTTSSSSNASGIAATPKAVKAAYDRASTGITNAATAQAAADAAINALSVSGKVITYTKNDGTTGTITTQDTNTTYSNMTAATSDKAGTAGLVPAPAKGKQTSFLRGDGTWVVPTNTTYTAASATPKAAGTAAVGTSAKYAREDHVHPAQTTVSGNAGTASKWATARTITIKLKNTAKPTYGECASGAVTIDGSKNATTTIAFYGGACDCDNCFIDGYMNTSKGRKHISQIAINDYVVDIEGNVHKVVYVHNGNVHNKRIVQVGDAVLTADHIVRCNDIACAFDLEKANMQRMVHDINGQVVGQYAIPAVDIYPFTYTELSGEFVEHMIVVASQEPVWVDFSGTIAQLAITGGVHERS